MKKVMFAILMFMGLAMSVSAQKEELYYYSDSKGTTFVAREFIDRSANMYYFDGDSPNDCEMEIRNYKKNGDTETFDIYVKEGHKKGTKRGSITIVTDPNLDIKAKELDLSKQKVTIKDGSYTYKYYFLTGKQNDKRNGKSSGVGGENPVDKAKDKGKALLNKGKGLLKKKK